MKFRILETIIALFLTAILIVCIVFAYNNSYSVNENLPAEETNTVSETTPVSKTEVVGRTPVMEAPLIENDYNIGGSFVGTVLEETTQYMIVEAVEIEGNTLSGRITIEYPKEHIGYLYGIGTEVNIKYSVIEPNTPYIKIVTDDITVISE